MLSPESSDRSSSTQIPATASITFEPFPPDCEIIFRTASGEELRNQNHRLRKENRELRILVSGYQQELGETKRDLELQKTMQRFCECCRGKLSGRD